MYFGTRERMTWVKCPAFNADLSTQGWGTSGTYLNGGGYVRGSLTRHKVFQFAWNLAKSEDIRSILDYSTGMYGEGPIYFLDPFAVSQNVLPMYWSAPRLAKEDAPVLIKDQRPTLVTTGTNTFGYPTKSAVYTLTSASRSAELFIPVPEGYTFHLGVHGTATGTAKVSVTPVGLNGNVTTAQTAPVMTVDTSQRTNTAISSVSGVTLSLTGAGVITLAGLIAQILPDGQDVATGGFISGQGNSGVRFEPGSITLTGYSSPEAQDLQGATATLREVAAWE